MVLRDLIWVKWVQLGNISNAVSKFAHGAQDAGTVCFWLTTFLAHTELNGKPVNSGKSLKFELGRPQTCQTDLLTEFCKIFVRKHRRMSKQLVDDVWLGRVQGSGVMSDVLGRMEYLKS